MDRMSGSSSSRGSEERGTAAERACLDRDLDGHFTDDLLDDLSHHLARDLLDDLNLGGNRMLHFSNRHLVPLTLLVFESDPTRLGSCRRC